MNPSSSIRIVHLSQPDGTARFLHSLNTPDSILAVREGDSIEAVYGGDPKPEAIRLFRESIHERITEAIERNVRERTFGPRFLATAGTFLASFLALSVLIRDPLPIADELVVSSVAAGIVWHLGRRRSKRNESEAERELGIRGQLDKAYFQPDQGLRDLEGLWHRLFWEVQKRDKENLETWILGSVVEQDLTSLDPHLVHGLKLMLVEELGKRRFRSLEGILKRVSQGTRLSLPQRKRLHKQMTDTTDSEKAQLVCLLAAVLVLESLTV